MPGLWDPQDVAGQNLFTVPQTKKKPPTLRERPLTAQEVRAMAAYVSSASLLNVQRLQQNHLQAIYQDPDKTAEVLRLSQQSGYPAWMLQKDGPARKDAEAEDIFRQKATVDWGRVIQETPATAAFLLDPKNMAVAYDDLDNLVSHENALQALVSGWRVSRMQMELASYAGKLRLGQKLTKEEQARWEWLNQELAKEQPRRGLASFTYEAGKFLPQRGYFLLEGAKMGLAAATAAGLAALAGGVTAPAAPTLAASAFVAGTSAGAFKTSHDLEANLFYNNAIRMGINPDKAALVAEGIGIINGALELGQLSVFTKPFIQTAAKVAARKAIQEGVETAVKRELKAALAAPTVQRALLNFAKNYTGSIAEESLQEVLQEVTNIVGEEFLKRSEKLDLPPATAQEIVDRLGQTAVETAKGMALLGLPGQALNLGVDMKAVRESRMHQELAQALNDQAAKSKLRTRLPQGYRAFIESLAEEHGVDTAYIAVEAFDEVFNQEGVPGEQAAQALGLLEEYRQAKQAGTDIAIPLPVYQEKLAGTPAGIALVPDTKFDPDGMTAREAQLAEAQLAEAFRKAQERAKAVAEDQAQQTQDEAYIHQAVKEQLLAVGRPEEEAEYAAAINAAWFTTMAERSGKSARELFESVGLRVQKGEAPQAADAAQELTQSSVKKVPSWVSEARDTRQVPEGWYLHGRAERQDLNTGHVLQLSRDWHTAETYAGRQGSIWLIRPTAKARVLDLSSPYSSEMQAVVDKALAQAKTGRLPFLEDILRSLDFSKADINTPEFQQALEEAIRNEFSPGNIVSSARAYDNPEWVQWLSRNFRPDFVLTPDGAVAITHRNIESVQVPQETANIYEQQIVPGERSESARKLDEEKAKDPLLAKRLGALEYDLAALRAKFRVDQVTPEEFIAARAKTKRPQFLTFYPAEELKNFRLYLTEDGVGFALKPNGELVNVFNNSPRKGAGAEAVFLAIAEGARTLDCFSGYLDEWYSRFGFDEVRRDEWDDRFAPEGWDYDRDHRPDIVYFRFNDELPRDSAYAARRFALAEPGKRAADVGGLLPGGHAETGERARGGLGAPEPGSAGGPTGVAVEGPPREELEPLARRVPRASIQFAPGETVITLFQKADASSFMHESAHFWLNLTKTLAEQEGATDSVKQLWSDIRTWLGAEEGKPLTKKQHEQFAKGFEQYLSEGKAPTSKLATAFEVFRKWLLQVYRRVRGFGQPVSDEVRSIFDRMLASDEALIEATAQQRLDETIADHTEVSAEEKTMLTEAQAAAREEARRELLRRTMVQLRSEYREKERALAEKLTEELTARHAEEPVYRLIADLTKDGAEKLNLEELQKLYPKDTVKRLTSPGRKLAVKGGTLSLEDVAEEYGFSSGDEMVQKLLAAPSLKALVEHEVRQQIEAQRPSREEIQAAALEVIHNEAQLELLALEEQILTAKLAKEEAKAQAKAQAQAVKEEAQRQLVALRWTDARRFERFLAAERKAARQAFDALEKGDKEKAAEFKRQQLLNAALVRESLRLRREFEKIEALFERITKRKDTQTLGLDREELAQLDQLLFRYGLGDGLKEGQEAPSLAEWAQEMETGGEAVSIPDEVLDGTIAGNWKNLTTDEALAVYQAVQNIINLGRRKHKLGLLEKEMDFQAAVDELVVQAASLGRDTKQTVENYKTDSNITWLQRSAEKWRSWNMEHTKIEYLCRWLDGGQDMGPWWRLIYLPIAQANERESIMRREAAEKLKALYDTHYTPEQLAEFSRKVYIPELGMSMTKEEMLALALNWGNEGNRQRVRDGQGWSDEQVWAVLNKLEKNDWDFVQGVWDLLDSYWPLTQQMLAKLGSAPVEKVKPAPVETRFGTYRGGYYPIVYDTKWSEQAHAREASNSAEAFFAKRYLFAATKKGHLKERAARVQGRPVYLNGLAPLSEHLTNVLHDLCFRPAIRDVWKLVNNKEVEEAVVRAFGREAYRLFKPWLADVANEYRNPVSTLEKFLAAARKNATVAVMAWKVSTAIDNVSTLFPIGRRVGFANLAEHLLDFYANPFAWKEKAEFVYERSAFMLDRAKSRDRDVRHVLNTMHQEGRLTKVVESFFWLHELMDRAITLPAWMAAYEKEFTKSGDEQRAILYADSVIRQSQPSGYTSDLAQIQRGTEAHKMLTMFYGYFNVVYNEVAEDIHLFTGAKDVPRLAGMLLFTLSLPALAAALVTGQEPGEDENKLWWAVKTVLAYGLGSMVLVRDAARTVLSGRAYQAPLGNVLNTLTRLPARWQRAMEEGEARPLLEDLYRSAGYLGVPLPQQLLITFGNIYDWMTGDDADFRLRDVFFTRPKE